MLNEHDLKDWDMQPQPVALYKVPRNSYISLGHDVPLYNSNGYAGTWLDNIFLFDHIDGAYSVCYTLAKEMFHLGASTPVFIWSKKSDGQTKVE